MENYKKNSARTRYLVDEDQAYRKIRRVVWRLIQPLTMDKNSM